MKSIVSALLLLALVIAGASCIGACSDDRKKKAVEDVPPDDDADADVDVDPGDTVDTDVPPGDAADAPDMVEPPLVTYTEQRTPCANRSETRNPYFGDLHIHTRWSFDAWVEGTRPDPSDAYRFAKGEQLMLPPLDMNGVGTQSIQLARPLDFAAVTDHAEYLGEVLHCTDPGQPGYDHARCLAYREMTAQSIADFGTQLTNDMPTRLDLCDDVDCDAANASVWQMIQNDAETHYDRSENCTFTTFVAYEWSANTAARNHHRNVIFRNETVPASPASYIDYPSAEALWGALDRDCVEPDAGCQVLAIPHNSNLSNGGIFMPLYPGATNVAEERVQATQRARLEPLVEIFQHKGNSECANYLSGVMGEPDELCTVEAIRLPPFDECQDGMPGALGIRGAGCVSRWDYVRTTLIGGLAEQARLGVNPYKMGVIASTDTHNAIPGAADEDNYLGHVGNAEALPDERLDDAHLSTWGIVANPGGLAGVWAVENGRDALYEALVRRETFGTSGTRITPRFFGGWSFENGICDDTAMVDMGYRDGVPMGADLPAYPGSGAPQFVVAANRDPSDSASDLQVAQVIKGWIDAGGDWHYEVFDVAGDRNNGATVDTATCQQSGSGAATLCGVWEDPSFDPTVPAFYYARIAENPACRWSTIECNALDPMDRPAKCDDASVPKDIQEMAWTSAIWYTP